MIFKARWQSLSRTLRAELAEALGAAADRVAGHMAVGPRIQFVADVVATRSGQRLAGVPPVLAPGMVADQLRGASAAVGEGLAAAAAAVEAGLACPEGLASAVGEYNDALATARQVLADHGVVPVPDGRAALLDRLRELAVNADREPMRTAAAAIGAAERAARRPRRAQSSRCAARYRSGRVGPGGRLAEACA